MVGMGRQQRGRPLGQFALQGRARLDQFLDDDRIPYLAHSVYGLALFEQPDDQIGAGLRRAPALLRRGDLVGYVGELLVEDAGVVGAGEQVVVDPVVGHRRLGFLHLDAEPVDLLPKPRRGLGGVRQRLTGAAAYVGLGDRVGDAGGELRIGRAHKHGDDRRIAFLNHRQPVVEVLHHDLVEALGLRRATEELQDQPDRGEPCPGQLRHGPQVLAVDHGEQRVARLDELDLARHHRLDGHRRGGRLLGRQPGQHVVALFHENAGRRLVHLGHEQQDGKGRPNDKRRDEDNAQPPRQHGTQQRPDVHAKVLRLGRVLGHGLSLFFMEPSYRADVVSIRLSPTRKSQYVKPIISGLLTIGRRHCADQANGISYALARALALVVGTAVRLRAQCPAVDLSRRDQGPVPSRYGRRRERDGLWRRRDDQDLHDRRCWRRFFPAGRTCAGARPDDTDGSREHRRGARRRLHARAQRDG